MDMERVWRRGLPALMLYLAVAAGMAAASPGVAAREMAAEGQPAAIAQLNGFNGAMLKAYGDGRGQLAAARRPVILLAGDDAILITDAGREARRYTPQIYHTLKSGSHVVLGLTGVMAPALEGLAGASDWRDGLRKIDAEIAALLPHSGDLGLSAAQAARQQEMMARVRAYIAAELPKAAPDRAAFVDLMAAIKPFWLADAADAARAQLVALHDIVDGWRTAMDPADWARLHVVVPGAPAARAGNLQVQYFLRMLGEPAPGNRVIYSENLFSEDRAMGVYAATLADRVLAGLVFGDAFRMDRDLLGFAAGSVLDDIMSGGDPH